MPKFKVQFTCAFEVEVECELEDLADTIANTNIPEDSETKYVPDTFDVSSVTNEDGSELPIEDIP